MEKIQGLINVSTGEKQVLTGRHGPLVIAGPCSAESPRQLLETALALREQGSIDYFRAGIWKPRTSPDSFQGVGAQGLKWLKDLREETGLKVATEVACEKHVAEAMKYEIDLIWIGARTVSNPFVVQEIAESLRGTDIPVLVKNPLNPDLELWYGAINRFVKLGIKNVGAIHRGFSVWGKSIFRNPPIWEIPLALKERMPGITVICDPSHITGKRSLVGMVSGRAIKEGLDGLMVEVHPEPENAMSDASQQLCPQSFAGMLRDLDLLRNRGSVDDEMLIDELRSEMDMVDELLVNTIANRMELSKQMARIGDRKNLKTGPAAQWENALKRALGIAGCR